MSEREGVLTIADAGILGEDGDGPDRGVLDVGHGGDDLGGLVRHSLLAAVDLEVEVAALDEGVLHGEDVRVADRVAAHAQAVGDLCAVCELAEVPGHPVGVRPAFGDGVDAGLGGCDLCRPLRERGGDRRGADGEDGRGDEGGEAHDEDETVRCKTLERVAVLGQEWGEDGVEECWCDE